MKRLLKPALQRLGLLGITVRVYRSPRWLRIAYSVAVGLRLGFASQFRVLPFQFLEQIIYVSPATITQRICGPTPASFRTVLDGDWDLDAETLEIDSGNYGYHYRLMHEMFVEAKSFDQTSQFKRLNWELQTKGETVDQKFRTEEQIVDYLKGYEPIFNDIKANGYKTQEELEAPPFIRSRHEIKVGIGRDGDFLFLDQGNHRLAIAKILGINCVPVSVWTVHKHWAERCFQEYGGNVLDAVHKGLAEIDCRRLLSQSATDLLLGQESLPS